MRNAQNIFLTGTGTIGRELLLALLRNTANRISVLMRERGKRTVADRAARLFDELSLTATERARVTVLEGDVTVSDFNLGGSDLDRLIKTTDLCIHTAATTSLTADRALCESVNRTGTANALTLAARCLVGGRLKRFVHLSTAFVAGGGSDGIAYEDELPISPAHLNHYEWSKYEAERLVRVAMRAGLPATIFRPSMVVGESETGRTRDFNVIYPLLRIMASGYVRRFPADPQACVNLAPIDFVVAAILRGIDEEWTNGLTFHLTTPQPPMVAELLDCEAFFPAGSSRPQLCSPQSFSLADCGSRERELLETVAFCFPYFNSRLRFDTRNTARLCALPNADAAYLRRLGNYAVASGYLRRAA